MSVDFEYIAYEQRAAVVAALQRANEEHQGKPVYLHPKDFIPILVAPEDELRARVRALLVEINTNRETMESAGLMAYLPGRGAVLISTAIPRNRIYWPDDFDLNLGLKSKPGTVFLD